jgi:hypothetical protein
MMALSRGKIVVFIAAVSSLSAQPALAQTASCPKYYFALRSDFNDLSPFSCPGPDTHAQGALASETYNTLTGQNSASFDGLAALTYLVSSNYSSSFRGLTAGVFVQANVTHQFQPMATQASNSDTVTSGAFTQFAFANLFNAKMTDFFRLRGGETDASTGSRSATFVGEWIPQYAVGLGSQADLGLITVWPAPELMVQYDNFLGGLSKAPLFFARDDALRLGPQLVLTSWFTPNKLPSALKWLYDLKSLITFHESWDIYTGRNYRWVQTSLTYDFTEFLEDKTWKLGVTASYGYGNLEATGTATSQAKLGLSIKH